MSLLPKFVALLVLFAESVLCTINYDNVAGGDLFVECDPGYGMSQVASSYTTTGGGFGDRRWDWDCRKIDKWHRVYCEWKNAINELETPFYFQCPADAFIAGVRSVYNPNAAAEYDRLWDVKCCRVLTVCLRHCELSDKVNEIQDPMDHEADEDYGVFNGFYGGPFDPTAMDRQYRLGQCKFEPCDPYKKSLFSKKHF